MGSQMVRQNSVTVPQQNRVLFLTVDKCANPALPKPSLSHLASVSWSISTYGRACCTSFPHAPAKETPWPPVRCRLAARWLCPGPRFDLRLRKTISNFHCCHRCSACEVPAKHALQTPTDYAMRCFLIARKGGANTAPSMFYCSYPLPQPPLSSRASFNALRASLADLGKSNTRQSVPVAN